MGAAPEALRAQDWTWTRAACQPHVTAARLGPCPHHLRSSVRAPQMPAFPDSGRECLWHLEGKHRGKAAQQLGSTHPSLC